MSIPHEILSDALQNRINGRQVEVAVFLTFKFDPAFFEQEVLPVLLDVPSQAHGVKLLMLEDALRDRIRHAAVYYDRNGLHVEKESAKLDIRRIAITQSGFFHPKNVLLLVRPEPTEEVPEPAASLIVATMSANITRAGWWENVEVCHIEEIASGDRTSLRDDLMDLIRRVKLACRAEERHEALDDIRTFLQRETTSYQTASDHGTLRPRLYSGGGSVPDFLSDVLGRRADGCNLEVISPYFDEATAVPLQTLIERFSPREVRVLLPRDQSEVALCSEQYWQAVLDLAEATGAAVSWGTLPGAMLSTGKGELIVRRRVHAKVYRFFRKRPAYEAFFIGSVNLTSAGHQRGGNFETGIVIETDNGRPGWWLLPDENRPTAFERESEGEEVPSALLGVRYHWDQELGSVYWDAASASPPLEVTANGPPLFRLEPLPPREWVDLTQDQSELLKARLEQSSFLTVAAEGHPPATILVQEEGMAHKPSLLVTLPIEDILKYWALLTPEQKAAFLESRIRELTENDLTIPKEPIPEISSMFSTFAGIFHAFSGLQDRLDRAFDEGRLKQIDYYLFGPRYDSLPSLLKRAVDADPESDPVRLYVVALCAKQLVGKIRKERREFAKERRAYFVDLKDDMDAALKVRRRIDMPAGDRKAFLDWFEKWFLKSAPPIQEPTP
jgi:hypothetical protein